MRPLILLFISLFALPVALCSQSGATIRDVDFFLDGNFIVVNYTIEGTLPREVLTIELAFITENNETITPVKVSGDVGTSHFSDGAKKIIWDIISDHVSLSGNIKAIVTIKSSRIIYGGPSNAFLSVIVPGLGGHFVEKNKTRSIATTISTLGLLGYGIYQKNISDNYYDDYIVSEDPAEIENLYNKANNAHHRYIISTGIAVGIWAFDIAWVAVKGFKNKKEASAFYHSLNDQGLRLYYSGNTIQMKYSISF